MQQFKEHSFTNEDKEACIPLFAKFIKYANQARAENLFALEAIIKTEEDLFLREGMMMIIDGFDAEHVQRILSKLILSDRRTGAELLQRLVMVEGILGIQRGDNPFVIIAHMSSLLGEKYFKRTIN